jgi:single-strand DNA-binding protein
MFEMNECWLTGVLAQDPETTFTGEGKQCTTARLAVPETNLASGQTFTLWVGLEAWGKAAQTLADLHEGDPVLVRGKLKWKSWLKDGQKQGTLVVAVWQVQPARTPAMAEGR